MTKPYYRTSDTKLAAYLFISGISLKEILLDIYPVEFVFYDKSQNGTIGELLLKWDKREAIGNLFEYHRVYNRFIRQIHMAKDENKNN